MLYPRRQNCTPDEHASESRVVESRPGLRICEIENMKRFQIYEPAISASDFQIPHSMESPAGSVRICSEIGASESFLPKDYESHPVFSYNIDTAKDLSWDSDAQSLHELWMKNAKTSVSHDRYPHAAIKRLMRLNPEVFQVCAEVLAPLSLLADMFVGMLLLGASHNQQPILTEKGLIHSSIAPNPLLMWALDAIDVNELLNLQPGDDLKCVANVLPELLVRQYPPSIKKKLIVAHFKLLEASDGPLGEIPEIIDASGRVLTSCDVLGTKRSGDTCINVERAEAPNAAKVARFSAIVLEDQYQDRPPTSEILSNDMTETTQNQRSREIEGILTRHIPDSTLNALSRENTRDHCHAFSPPNPLLMEYVSFFSHIDPWFENEYDRDDFGSPHDFVKTGSCAIAT